MIIITIGLHLPGLPLRSRLRCEAQMPNYEYYVCMYMCLLYIMYVIYYVCIIMNIMYYEYVSGDRWATCTVDGEKQLVEFKHWEHSPALSESLSYSLCCYPYYASLLIFVELFVVLRYRSVMHLYRCSVHLYMLPSHSPIIISSCIIIIIIIVIIILIILIIIIMITQPPEPPPLRSRPGCDAGASLFFRNIYIRVYIYIYRYIYIYIFVCIYIYIYIGNM